MKKTFKKVAKNNKTTPEQVEKDISEAIEIAIKNENKSRLADDFWNELLKDGDKPKPEEVILKIVARIIADSN